MEKLKKYQTEKEIQIVLADYFDYRRNIIVPNVSWGLFSYEIDLLVLTSSGYATEIEIKTSKSDLLADKKKSHGHYNKTIKKLYFAISTNIDIDFALQNIPDRAGLIVIDEIGRVIIIKKPVVNNRYKWGFEMRLQLARLGVMRFWSINK